MSIRRTKRRSGFTLIEILLVAGILALLAAFAVPKLMNTAQEARIKLAEATIGRNGPIAKGLEAYKWNMGKFPETSEGLAVLFQTAKEANDENYKGPYMDGTFAELKDPWGQAFEYRSPGEFNEDGYDLWSYGPDKENNSGKEGSDDIKNWVEK
ncbi:MAG: type II secretion system major pseudopilin GspG [Candidatus Eisenbacteria bacterium]|nr:type II secretion system major pseudopilin GspG [Candidatus Eisenbacteria bacterium]